ncbi:ATP19 family protein ASCRUDRAFT_78005 [Ascoidea rubescens DSM 1968]|uniref:ATP synthase subunit K, mitochondrial n=1 Tax=Ascoidea rubescens DSM 1968 TaxID=1344418 RepID=A0A1D2V9Q9_9ASCO|nr:hypothetical protein ASCRUDRAFT_78005 [Ascoidea rubescens DSM 1968]ODV58309.1 hypothetical protein ASCRUDRAFT_78005 [Ascoidea rubescens DSM 1968]
MVSYYTVLGKKVPSHILAIATIVATVGGIALPKYIPSSKSESPKVVPPPVETSASKDEEFDFEKLIGDFLKEEQK